MKEYRIFGTNAKGAARGAHSAHCLPMLGYILRGDERVEQAYIPRSFWSRAATVGWLTRFSGLAEAIIPW